MFSDEGLGEGVGASILIRYSRLLSRDWPAASGCLGSSCESESFGWLVLGRKLTTLVD